MKALIKLLTTIEEKLNKIIIKILELMSVLLVKIIPPSFFQSAKRLEDKRKSIIGKFQTSSHSFLQNLKEANLQKLQKYKTKIKSLKVAELKEKMALLKKGPAPFIEEAKKLPTNFPFFQSLKTSIDKFHHWLSHLNPAMFLGFFFIAVSISFISLNILKQASSVYRKLSSTQDVQVPPLTVLPRPAYYKGDKKLYFLERLTFPVYLQKSKGVKNFILDISMESSNRFVTLYFSKKEHEVLDFLYSTLEPMIPSLPLEDEGKVILKEKVQLELNNYLKKKKIRGEVIKVYIQSMIVN